MRYRIEQIKLNLDEALVVNNAARAIKVEGRWGVFCNESVLAERIAKKLGKNKVRLQDIGNIEIVRRSIDARGSETKFVYTLDFDCGKKLNMETVATTATKKTSGVSKKLRPVVVGFGPCGMFAALVLARAGMRPIVIERGASVDERVNKVQKFWNEKILDPECNVQFGEGGAGTFSDGKLNTGIKDKRIRFVLETFVDAGASPDILIDARPHIGTDVLRTVVKNIREEIIALGGGVRFNTKLVGIEPASDENIAVAIERQGDKDGQDVFERIDTDSLVLALGHSARDTMRMLYDCGIKMEPKSFSMGVRVQHSQELIDRGTYGDDYGHPALTPAYYKLSHRADDGRGVYSFCMCPGGEIVNAASQEGGVVTNGMSNAARNSGFANSGILVDVKPGDYSGETNPMAGIAFQEKYERLAFVNGGSNYTLPQTTWGEYRSVMVQQDQEAVSRQIGESVLPGENQIASAEGVIDSLPGFVAQDIYEAMPVFGKKIKGFDNDDTLMVAIESRSSSPVRMIRDKETLEAEFRNADEIAHDTYNILDVRGIYPGGEGAGYAGGITSAACDGIRIAEMIIEKQSKRNG